MTDSPIAGGGIHRPVLGAVERHIAQSGLSWRDLPRIWELAHQLCGLCVQSHVLRPDSCPVEGFLRPCPLVTDEMIDAAQTSPPAGAD